ncbi:caspase-14-like [Anopheles marshallii]|uniref:caspase-14-like n=1 Tax=Anopheles marshallii TaxID=1521116 RepID=UPI00237A92D7|nr:caspase-14-like [Anopheles marshallii]
MGSFGSKSKQPASDRKTSSIQRSEMISDGYTAKSSSVTMTKQIRISQTVQSTRTFTAATQTIQSTGTGTTTSVPTQTYKQVYRRPSLTTLPDASVVRPSSAQTYEFSRPPIPNTATYTPATHGNDYDLSKKAYVLVFHHYKFQTSKHNREGSSKDMRKIEEIIRYYRCDRPDINENKTARDVRKKMETISKKDFTEYSCLIVFIMSHGDEQDSIMAYDGNMYSLQSDIVEQCTMNRTLNDKPKIFVVQACRGDAKIVADATRSMSHKIDIVAFQSSYQGTVSFRHVEQGSFFMQAFLQLLHGNNQKSILDVNEELNREFRAKNILQTPTLTTTLQKKLIFGQLLRRP